MQLHHALSRMFDAAACEVSETWSGLKLVMRKSER
jgi:hypothetical protein